jgi:hypothetical protein
MNYPKSLSGHGSSDEADGARALFYPPAKIFAKAA